MVDLKKYEGVSYYTTSHCGIFGIGWSFFSGPIANLFIPFHGNRECDLKYLRKIDNLYDLSHTEAGVLKRKEELQTKIADCEQEIEATNKKLSQVAKLKVRRSKLTAHDIYERIKEKRNESEYSKRREIDVRKNGSVRIPQIVKASFYASDDDLLQFSMGDVVEIKFGDGYRVQNRYKGKTLTLVVNNIHSYEYRNKTKRLALTPNKEGWGMKDIVIVDDADRFECLMIDLYPENQIPYRGWESKIVTIKKVGHLDAVPKPHARLTESYEDFETALKDDEWAVLYKSNEKDPPEVCAADLSCNIKKNGLWSWGAHRIYTSRDKELARDYLQKQNSRKEKDLADLKKDMDAADKSLALIAAVREQRVIKKAVPMSDVSVYLTTSGYVETSTNPKEVVASVKADLPICIVTQSMGVFGYPNIKEQSENFLAEMCKNMANVVSIDVAKKTIFVGIDPNDVDTGLVEYEHTIGGVYGERFFERWTQTGVMIFEHQVYNISPSMREKGELMFVLRGWWEDNKWKFLDIFPTPAYIVHGA